MPAYDLYFPDYKTYRLEKELYSFNLIDYMYEDGNKKVWLSTEHDLKRTNGYQFFNISQIFNGQNPLKGHISRGMYWNDSTQYLVEEIDQQMKKSYALSSRTPTTFTRLDSSSNAVDQLLFYDVVWNGLAYEIWLDSVRSPYLKEVSHDGLHHRSIQLPDLNGQITGFCVTKNNLWFVLDQQKIVAFEITEDGFLNQTVELISPNNIHIFHSDQNDNIWVSHFNSVLQVRKFTTGYELITVAPLRNMEQIFEDTHGNLILGKLAFPNNFTETYLYLQSGGRWIDFKELLDSHHDIHFFAGRNFQKEIFLGAQNSFSTLRFSDNRFSERIVDRKSRDTRWNFIARGLYKTDSMLYVLASNKGMLLHNLISGKEKLLNFTDPQTGKRLKFDCLRTIERDPQGKLWFSTCKDLEAGTSAHLIMYDPELNSSQVIPFPNPITAIQMDSGSNLYIANTLPNLNQAITKYDTRLKKAMTTFEVPKRGGKINDIYPLSDDSLLLATDIGLFGYGLSVGKMDTISVLKDHALQTEFFAIFQYDEKFFLAGKDGLFIYDPISEKVNHFNIDNGLRNNIVTAIFRERKNKYWISTFNGVTMINLDENLILNFSTLDGLPENEFNLYSYFQKDYEMYLGYPNGVIRLNLRDSMVDYFSNFGLDHALVYKKGNDNPSVLFAENNKLIIPADISYFKLFSSSYAAYFIDNFYFKLINTTISDTISFSAINGAVLSNLKAGTYQYKIHTYDRYGNIMPGSKSFQVTIEQHFLQSTWFRFLTFFMGNVLIALLIYWWLRVRNRKKRTKNLMDKRLSEMELQVLQAQLNPHFIFNSISAIQYYIQDHDEEKADTYLTAFSRLMRMYLDSSKSSYIRLSKEISLLSNYLDLEMMVSDGQIESHYEIDPEINQENIVIPTMMLQPFVENAIQHGLFHKKDKGTVYLRFIKLGEDKLLCEIEDDGIGRVKADYFNRLNKAKPVSRALQIINEKLEVLKATRGLNIEIEIIDKYHKEEAMGTLVRITFPIIYAKNVREDLVQM